MHRAAPRRWVRRPDARLTEASVQTEVGLAHPGAMDQPTPQEPIAVAVSPEDIAYVRASYVTLDQLARGVGEAAWPGTRPARPRARRPAARCPHLARRPAP
jgi:hypothetical protein